MKTLIIGHRGFVGSNLASLFPDASGAGRAEISQLSGVSVSNIYCAAPQAKKWWANQNPTQDRQEVQDLLAACRRLTCTESFVLFSTVDVYDPPLHQTELDQPSLESHPYGANRLWLEQAILEHFGDRARIIRLPALVGMGLKKNVIYDLLHDNNIEKINGNSSFQWFNLAYLAELLECASSLSSIPILNAVTEPVATRSIIERWFPQQAERVNWSLQPIGYDLRTIHGPNGLPYWCSHDQVLNKHLKNYLEPLISSN